MTPTRSARRSAPPLESPDATTLCVDVRQGLAARPRRLPPKYFYDDRGAQLFERIMELDEYYLTRTELGILERHIGEMAALAGPRARVIEFGSGSGAKTRILLEHLEAPASYVPIDIARTQLLAFADSVARRMPDLQVLPVWADYTAAVTLPPARAASHTLAFFPGSTIGNFEPAEAEAFLRRVWRLCGPGGQLLLGADLHKDRAVLEPAYNDAAGITAEFNLNLLARINRECGTDFDSSCFRHFAFYDDAHQRIEMRLVCTRDCTVLLPARHRQRATRSEFAAGDFIITEYSYKFDPAAFARLAERTGWTVQRAWFDERQWFGVWLLARP
jgi:dimethylhistidine N-methyltransferase